MPSQALVFWESDRAAQLDEMESAHAAVGGTTRGRRYVTEQINHAYAVLLASQFQGFCRDLHTESVAHMTDGISPAILRNAVARNFEFGRSLDRGNANAATIGSDFGRLMLSRGQFWDEVDAMDTRTAARRQRLEHLNRWRNAIAHQDFSQVGSAFLQKSTVQEWRRACVGLAKVFDRVMAREIATITGVLPW